MFQQKQLLILGGMLAAVIASIIVVFFVAWGAPDPLPTDAGEKLAFAMRWLLAPGLALFVGVGVTANRRFFLPSAIDGERNVEDGAFEINLRYNQNTLEQLALAAVAWTGLALVLPVEEIGVVARMAVMFGAGRLAFWMGYHYAPWARAFGMGLTAYPTFGALAYLAWTAFQ
jgi:hypothetical protein